MAENFGYRMRSARGPAQAMKPSVSAGIMIIMTFAIFVLAGGVYNILEKPIGLLPRGGGWTFIYRGNINIQTFNESVLVAILYVIGAAGLYMLLRSTRLAYRPRQAYILLIMGFVVTIISVYYAMNLINAKTGA